MRKSMFVGIMVVLLFMGSFYQMAKADELEKAERPEWKIGYKWSYEITHSGYPDKVFETKEEIIAKEEFKKISCYVMSISRGELSEPHSVTSEAYVTEDLNVKAAYRRPEKGSRYLQCEFIPERKTFDWPLEVGKKWEADYRVKQKAKKGYMRSRIKGVFEVEKIEKIKIPAGEFQTFKIVLKVRRGRKLVVFQEWWYSPKLYCVVKGKKYWQGGDVENYHLLDFNFDL